MGNNASLSGASPPVHKTGQAPPDQRNFAAPRYTPLMSSHPALCLALGLCLALQACGSETDDPADEMTSSSTSDSTSTVSEAGADDGSDTGSEASEESDTGDGDGDGDAAAYSQCETSSGCGEHLECTFAVQQCLAGCLSNDFVDQCPAPPDGDAQPACAWVQSGAESTDAHLYCVLSCEGELGCPTGMLCQTTELVPGSAIDEGEMELCVWP